MKISVVTVVRNRAGTIEDAIRSVSGQRHTDKEHVIIDGGSTDATLEILARHRADVSVLVSEPDNGMYDAMNKGLARATGDAIGFLNSDDVYVDDTVLGQVASVLEDSQVDACYADLVYVDRNDPTRVTRYWRSQPYRDGLFADGWMPAHPTFFVRRDIYRSLGGFDTRYRRQADFELALRFFLRGKIRARYVPRVWVRMRSGGASSGIAHIVQGNIESYRACRENGLKVTPLFVARKLLSRVPQFFRRPRASG